MTNVTIRAMPTMEEIDAVFESMLEQRSPQSDVCCVTVAQLSTLRHVIADQMRKSEPVAWMNPGTPNVTRAFRWSGNGTGATANFTVPVYTLPVSPDVVRDAERYRIVRNYYGVDLDDSDRRIYHDALDRQLDKDINEFGAKAMDAREGGE